MLFCAEDLKVVVLISSPEWKISDSYYNYNRNSKVINDFNFSKAQLQPIYWKVFSNCYVAVGDHAPFGKHVERF